VPATREWGLWPAQSNGVKSTASGVRMGTGWLKGTGPVELDYPFELVLAATQVNWLLLCCQFGYIDIYEGFYLFFNKKFIFSLSLCHFFFFFGRDIWTFGKNKKGGKKKKGKKKCMKTTTLFLYFELLGRTRRGEKEKKEKKKCMKTTTLFLYFELLGRTRRGGKKKGKKKKVYENNNFFPLFSSLEIFIFEIEK
jgi:hypothetical protein